MKSYNNIIKINKKNENKRRTYAKQEYLRVGEYGYTSSLEVER